MKTKTRKGFTLVELVIVIAVIAILAGVLIPTFSSLVKKANESADIQAAREMNTHLALEAATTDMTITNVYSALEEGGMTAKDYHPLVKDRFYFWDKSLNRVLYTDESYNVLFPENYKDLKSDERQWYSLSGKINEKEVKADGNGKVEVTTAEQLYYLSNNLDSVIGDKDTINITLKKDINAMGADIAFEFTNGTYTIGGADENNPVKIIGLAQTTAKTIATNKDSFGKKYASGFIAVVGGKVNGEKVTTSLTISNITIDGAVIGDLETGGVGALVGRINDGKGEENTPGTTVNISNCQVLNSTINGKNKVGALIGSSGKATITITNCNVDNCTVNCSEGESGMAIGCVYNNPTITIDKGFDTWITNTTLNLVDGEWNRAKQENVTVEYKDENDGEHTIENVTLVREMTSEGKEDKKMRMFKSNVYMTLQTASFGILKINSSSITTEKTTNAKINIVGQTEEITTNILYFV